MSDTTETRKPIGGAIGITIITGMTGGTYQKHHRSASKVISKGLYAGSIKETPGLPLHKKCFGWVKERGQAALPDPETFEHDRLLSR